MESEHKYGTEEISENQIEAQRLRQAEIIQRNFEIFFEAYAKDTDENIVAAFEAVHDLDKAHSESMVQLIGALFATGFTLESRLLQAQATMVSIQKIAWNAAIDTITEKLRLAYEVEKIASKNSQIKRVIELIQEAKQP